MSQLRASIWLLFYVALCAVFAAGYAAISGVDAQTSFPSIIAGVALYHALRGPAP